MVCLSAEGTIVAIIKDTICEGPKKQSTITLAPSKTVSSVFVEVGADFHYPPNGFELIIQNNRTGDIIILNQYKDKTLGEIGVSFEENVRNALVIGTLKNHNMTLVVNDATDDDLLLGASASPTTAELPSSSTDQPPALMSLDDFAEYLPYNLKQARDSFNYVGLVNQAMTCYLNSLLQALFMTPEFRNALYKWEFDGQVETKSIPFQLQRLFLNLQTSSKSAVETTELTRSFGWDLSEAWQQHDIQELCRVMFDALEQKFKDTEQANLINDLYEGKMLDYVKCLECSTEKSREDTFLDIPLPVRPFGSSVAYNSVEEALRAFVQPETLEGNNQYFCEKCNKKCDAHKGLKFTKFPYLLTLHLKRFDFDYSSMHRIKLNDKVVFPEILNLNSFIPAPNYAVENESIEERETVVKCDDCSTTDSGSALDDESCQCNEVSSTINGLEDNCQDDDEGIDMSSGNHNENEKNRRDEPKGPYTYELFSIMIHSGSATGGHYYAYIKDFQKNQWLCFNDQAVSRITEDDIRKTYGGGPVRGYYSSVYSSSTNAYMLMYRQIDKQRNCQAMIVDEFPEHIKNLLQQMKEKEESARAARERENDMYKLKIYCWHPNQNQFMDTKLFFFYEALLSELVADAHQRFKLDGIALEDCRLVMYDKLQDCIDCSFEGENLKFCDIRPKINTYHNEWLLEIKQPGTEFQVVKPGGVNMKVYIINFETEEVDGPTNFHVNPGETVLEVKNRLAKMFNLDVVTLKVVQETYSNEPHYLEEDHEKMKFDPTCNGYKLYVSNSLDEDPDKPFSISKLNKIIDRYVHIVAIDVVFPDTDAVTLESLSIPPLDLNQNLDKQEFNAGYRSRTSPQPGPNLSEVIGDHSNSEDSSLSDSDRTLVGDAPGECLALLSSHSNSPADQHMASPSDPAEDTYNHGVFRHASEEMNWDDDEPEVKQTRSPFYYFKGTMMSNGSPDTFNDSETHRCCRVQVDKRMNLAKLKKNLESFVGVSMEYFKVYRQYPHDLEWSRLTDTLGCIKDGDKLTIKLGRVLRKDEYSAKVFHLTPENSESFTFLFDWIIAKGQTVGQLKKEILFAAKKQHMLDIAYNKSRLRLKNWKNPGKVYLDDQKFVDDITVTNNFEIFLQDLGEGEVVTNSNQFCLFVKRWCPSTLTLTPFHEIVFNMPVMEELKRKLSEESEIPKEFIDVVFLKGAFPCDMNILDIHNELEWNVNVNITENWPLHIYQDGNVFLYRDSREQLKEITSEEKKEINQRENARLGKFSTKSHSPRRERALKIYLDTSPGKSDEGCGD